MKRVLIFTTAYFPHVGGAEVAIKEITNRLKDDFHFDLICAKYSTLPRVENIGGVTVYRVGWGIRILDKLFAPFLSAFLAFRLGKYDAYWAVMVTYGSLGAYLASFFTKIPILLTLQEGDPPAYLRRKWFGLIALSWRLTLSQSKKVSAISTYLARLAGEFGYRKEVAIIPNGVDAKRFFEIERTAHKDVVLVTTSRLVHKNAIDDIIRAIALLPKEVHCIIYGTGPLLDTLRMLAREKEIESRITFAGHISYEDIPCALSNADIFVRPSRSEGMGNSFIEAMAAGLPVIATQEGGIADFLFDEKRNPDKKTTGWAVDKDAPEQIAEAVKDILARPEKVKEVVKEARALVKELYDWNLIAPRMKTLLDEVVKKS